MVSNHKLDSNENYISHSILTILNTKISDTGNYTCNGVISETVAPAVTTFLNITIPGKVVSKKETVKLKIDGHDTLYCIFQGYPLNEFHWIKENDSSSLHELENKTHVERLNTTHVNLTLTITSINNNNNGSYHCIAKDVHGNTITDSIALLVLDKPKVLIDVVKVVGANVIFMNWTANDGNDPIKFFQVQFLKKDAESWNFYQEQIGGGNNSYLLKNFDNNTEYKLRITGKNSQGDSRPNETPLFYKTLEADPDFVPESFVTGVTYDSITIGWSHPNDELKDHVHYYELVAQAYNRTPNWETMQSAQMMNLYLFLNLESATTYHFKVRACNDYTKQCGQYSPIVNGKSNFISIRNL